MRYALSLLRANAELCMCVATIVAALLANRCINVALAQSADDRLLLAASTGDHAGVRRALRDGASVNRQSDGGFTPLMLAVQSGERQAVEQCLAAGADVGATGPRDFTALHWAASRGSAEIVRALLSHGAPIDSPDEGGHTPLYMAKMRGNDECAAALLAAGARSKDFEVTSPPVSP